MCVSSAVLRELFANASTLAIVGAKDTAGQPVDSVGRYLIQAGYTVIPVHPARKKVWELPVVANLKDIERPVDIVDLFRAPRFCPEHAREALAMRHRPRAFWMQSGICSPEAERILKGSGILVVADKCLKVEHARLAGSQ